MRMFLKQERTQTVSSCKQHITTSYKKKITKKSFHPFHHTLSYKSFLQCLSQCSQQLSVCQMLIYTAHFFFLSITVIRPFTTRTLSWKEDIYKREKQKYRARRSNINGVLAHAFSINTSIFFYLFSFNQMHLKQPWLYSLDSMCCLSGGIFFSLLKKKS